MGRPIEQNMFKVDMSHQEMERILSELEQWFMTAADNGAEWIAAEAAASWLRNDLGYEDQAEFEDALHGTFEDFLKAMPHLETKVDERGRLVFRVKPELPKEQWRPAVMTLRVESPEDLWNVCYKSQWARAEIPELEFEISQDGKKHIDSVYNHLAGAVFNLGTHIDAGGGGNDADRAKIAECLLQLRELMDLEQPWTWVLHDPSGTSSFQNMDRVKVEYQEAQ